MHVTAMDNCKLFFDTYSSFFSSLDRIKIIEIGSQDVNGSLRTFAPLNSDYIGLDFVDGKGVDVVLDDPYSLPLDSESADIIISSSCFEHSEMFWIVFLEVMRVLKPHGIFYLNVPSNGAYHLFPVDCWRFYPNSGGALVTWARRNSINSVLLESYISNQRGDVWNDFCGVFLKDELHISAYPKRIIDSFGDYLNGIKYGSNQIFNHSSWTEDSLKFQRVIVP
jgi:SAM-dependent methyltransferase